MSVELTIIRSSGAEVGYWYGKSTDTKPAAGTLYLVTGSKFYELDTKITHEYSEKNVNPDTSNGWWIKDDPVSYIQPLLEKLGYGLLYGMEVTAQDTPDMTVNMSAGVYHKADGTRQDVIALTSQVIQPADTVEDRIDLIYKNAAGVATYIVGILEIDAVAGARAYTIITNASEGDTVVIDGQTFTAIRTTPGTDEFNLGVSTTATATALYNCLNANTNITDLYTVTNPSAGVVRLVEKSAGGGDTPGEAVPDGDIEITNGTPTASVAGTPAVAGARQYTITVKPEPIAQGARNYTIETNAAEDDTIEIDGEILTAIRTTPGTDEFNIGATIALSATALYTLLGLNANIVALYDVTNPSDGVVVLTEKVAGGLNTPGAAVPTGDMEITSGTPTESAALTPAVAGARTYTITDRAEEGDTFTVEGEEFTCVNGTPGADEFEESGTIAGCATNLAAALAANATIDALYAVTNPSAGVIVLTEKVPGAGDTPGAATPTGILAVTNGDPTTSAAEVAAVAGERSYTVTVNASHKDEIALEGETFTALKAAAGTDEFVPGVDAAATALVLIDIINANAVLSAIYTAATGGSGIIAVTEDTPGGEDTPGAAQTTGTISITNGDPTVSKPADTITIDDEVFTAVESEPGTDEFIPGADVTAAATALAAVIALNAALSAIFTVTNPSAGVVVLTETVPGAGDTPGEAAVDGMVEITNGEATTSAAEIAAIAGARDYTVTNNASHKDTIALMEELFTALKPAAETDEFVPGETAALTATALYNLINANTVLSAIYTATNPESGVVLVTETTPGGLDTPGEAEVTGDIEITNGEATESVAHEDGGTVPATPAGGVALAEINVDANQTTVTTEDITDKRVAWITPGIA
jgi:hypothetical protein